MENTLIINKDLRTITIPESIKSLGVESDDDVLRLQFIMPKTYGDIDLSAFNIRINYTNAAGDGDVYPVVDNAVAGENITFSWLVGRFATKARGNVKFNVCLRELDEAGDVAREFNTTPAMLPVLEGLETTGAVVQQNPDILNSMQHDLAVLQDSQNTPRLLWEFYLPDASGISHPVTAWMDEYDFRFTNPNGDDLTWNGEWFVDGGDASLPGRPMREIFEELFALVKSRRHITVEFAFPGTLSVVAHPTIATATQDGVTVEKLIMILGDVTNPRTTPATLILLEFSQEGIVANAPIRDYAFACGMQIRAYA